MEGLREERKTDERREGKKGSRKWERKNWKRKKGLNDILEKEKEEGVGKIEQGKKHKMNNREA
jgi:hypothetical protein